MDEYKPEDDPYSEAMKKIMTALTWGLRHQGGMSEDELTILTMIYEVIEAEDPAALEMGED
jgi:hypothetical protein